MKPCTCTLACIPQGLVEGQVCRMATDLVDLCTCGPTTVAAGLCECGARPELEPLEGAS